MEAIGDITASAEVSRVEVEGPEFDTRIQGGVLVRKIEIHSASGCLYFLFLCLGGRYWRLHLGALHGHTLICICPE